MKSIVPAVINQINLPADRCVTLADILPPEKSRPHDPEFIVFHLLSAPLYRRRGGAADDLLIRLP